MTSGDTLHSTPRLIMACPACALRITLARIPTRPVPDGTVTFDQPTALLALRLHVRHGCADAAAIRRRR